MKIDLPENQVEDIAVVAVWEGGEGEEADWQVYLVNEKKLAITNVMVSSRGYGQHQDREVETSTLRHFIGDVGAQDFARIEPIDPQVFGLTNEYWVSFYSEGILFDKKFRFHAKSLVKTNLKSVLHLDKLGVLAE